MDRMLFPIVQMLVPLSLCVRIKNAIFEQLQQSKLEGIFNHAADIVSNTLRIHSYRIKKPQLSAIVGFGLRLFINAAHVEHFAAINAEMGSGQSSITIKPNLLDRSLRKPSSLYVYTHVKSFRYNQ